MGFKVNVSIKQKKNNFKYQYKPSTELSSNHWNSKSHIDCNFYLCIPPLNLLDMIVGIIYILKIKKKREQIILRSWLTDIVFVSYFLHRRITKMNKRTGSKVVFMSNHPELGRLDGLDIYADESQDGKI